MQHKIRKWVRRIKISGVMIVTAVTAMGCDAQASTFIEAQTLDSAIADHILQATVQITMVEREYEKKETAADAGRDEAWQEVIRYTGGIGTLVSHGGEVLLISHDHWSLFISGTTPDKVVFYDAQGALLLEIAGADLQPLILFHDSGTFILRAPEALAARALATPLMGNFETLNPGDLVHVVYHSPEQNDQISLLAAEIIGSEMYNGVPILSLRSLNGQSIEPGDSGGGLWVDGRLAGNLWMTMREVRQDWWRPNQSLRNETAFSLAAGLRKELINLVDILLQVETAPSIETGGVS